jgi:predicted nucleic acid-binding protein
MEQSLQVLEEFHAICDFIHPVERILILASDPDDNMILECAIASKAEFIISGDRHLLDLAQFRGISIGRSSECLRMIGEKMKMPTRKSRVRREARRRSFSATDSECLRTLRGQLPASALPSRQINLT